MSPDSSTIKGKNRRIWLGWVIGACLAVIIFLAIKKLVLDQIRWGVGQSADRSAAVSRGPDVVYSDLAEAIGRLKSEDARVQARMVEKLGSLEPDTVVPALVRFVEKSRPDASRKAAVQAIAAHGTAAREATDVLVEVLGDRDWPDRQAAAGALARVGVASRDVVGALLQRLAVDEDPAVRLASARALGELAVDDQRQPVTNIDEFVAGLRDALSDGDPHVRATAAEALGRIGPPAAAALPALDELQDAQPRSVARAATYAVDQITSGTGNDKAGNLASPDAPEH